MGHFCILQRVSDSLAGTKVGYQPALKTFFVVVLVKTPMAPLYVRRPYSTNKASGGEPTRQHKVKPTKCDDGHAKVTSGNNHVATIKTCTFTAN
jgi:hypothetical protein